MDPVLLAHDLDRQSTPDAPAMRRRPPLEVEQLVRQRRLSLRLGEPPVEHDYRHRSLPREHCTAGLVWELGPNGGSSMHDRLFARLESLEQGQRKIFARIDSTTGSLADAEDG